MLTANASSCPRALLTCNLVRAATLAPVKLVTGNVENGKVALPEGEFEEGAAVAVLESSADEPAVLTSAEEEALVESLSAMRSRNFISGEDLLHQLRSRGR